MYLMKCFSCLQLKSVELITKLDFSNSNLGEAFPEIWQYERTLEELHMTSTRLSSLPPQLFYCQSLRVLVLSSNNLENIPSAIGSLRQLQHLNLYRNLISSVPDTIKSCKNLTYLDLSCNNLQRLPDAITSVISLQELYLNETYLEFLPANFGRLVHLRILELRLNNLITLPKSMMRLCQLQRIDIGGNEFTELPEVIGELKQLRELWCDLNQIRRIPGNIAKLKDLIHFEANGNMLEEIPQGVFNMQKMEVISIYMNNLTTLPQMIGSMKFLVTLKCESNELEIIPDSISNLENLEELVLSHNHLRTLPETIGMLRKLRILFLDDNLLESIPNDLCSCCDLRILSVCDNRLYQLPEDIGHLGKLTVLNLVNNRISCLPVSILCLTNLKSLWLNDNQSQPLVPLQYIDINNKKQLTCFMLPQTVGTKSFNSNLNDTNREVFDENNRLAIDYEENQIAGISTAGVNFTKRICFAEEPTVLSTPPIDLKNMNKKSSIASAQKEKESLEVRLLRSPTPYPKELRLMAKYLRNGSKDNRQQDNMNLDVLYKNEIAEATYERLQHPTMQFQQCLPVNAIYQSQNELISNQSSASYLKDLEEIPYKNYTFEQLNDNVQNSFEIVQQHQFGQTVEPNSVITATRSNLDSVGLQSSYQHPPPYHIARSFTKKSPEDLTNYDVLSQQILKNSHTQHNFVPFTPNNVANLKNSQIEETLTSPNVILDHQNNNQTHEQDLMHNSNEQNMNRQIISNDSSTSSVTLLNDSLSINKSNSNLPNRSKSPWLFGTHKNPTVKQISIKWSNELGFEISTLENQDGIFVTSVMPNSNAAKLLFVKDKLLEVDGCDFSKISLSDARQILANPCAVLNIMISRI